MVQPRVDKAKQWHLDACQRAEISKDRYEFYSNIKDLGTLLVEKHLIRTTLITGIFQDSMHKWMIKVFLGLLT